MFPLTERNLPHVERLILTYLGPRDLVVARAVCKGWRHIVEVAQQDSD